MILLEWFANTVKRGGEGYHYQHGTCHSSLISVSHTRLCELKKGSRQER